MINKSLKQKNEDFKTNTIAMGPKQDSKRSKQ